MGGESPKPASSTPTGAVFLSYASQDSDAAKRICDALRAAGIEVWFDQSALRGGDVWDQAIRKQIKACVLFIPVLSKHTHDRVEGYFRLEWKLAIDRSHLIAPDQTFLLPVAIDNTREDDERVPDKFRDVHWTRLPGGETPSAFVEGVRRLVSPELAPEPTAPVLRAGTGASGTLTTRKPVSASWRSQPFAIAIVAMVILGGLAYFAIDRLTASKHQTSPPTPPAASAGAAPAAFYPPPHSIAVLPFVNMSGDKEQEYFSDGLTEELLNALAEINELQVAARTSAFSFKGKDIDIGTIARKLNVASVLEGSVRRSGNTVRITTQLINAVTGFHLWSHTYDRDLGDVLKLETEIAGAVASALKVTLLGDVSQKIELGGTRNPAAFDAYLRASKAFQSRHDEKDIPAAIAAYTEAIRLDPNYALAFAARSYALAYYTGYVATGGAAREDFEKAEADARQAIARAPELAQAHVALAFVSEWTLNFARARQEYEQALALSPGNAEVLRLSGSFAATMAHFEAGLAALRRAVTLDPLALDSHNTLGQGLYLARRYSEAATVFAEAISLNPQHSGTYGFRGLALFSLGDLQSARTSCEVKRDHWRSQWCLAVVYEKLGRHADAEAELAKMLAANGDVGAFQYSTTYAQWGDRAKALDWLDTAMHLRDPGVETLKIHPLMDPLRNEPRFQAIERELKFPE
jgi:TolB-like protein/Tfp pilus assembly protein PilF